MNRKTTFPKAIHCIELLVKCKDHFYLPVIIINFALFAFFLEKLGVANK